MLNLKTGFMDSKKVIIIHGSAIVQQGLANVLRNYFKCAVTMFSDYSAYSKSDEAANTNNILFIDEAFTDCNKRNTIAGNTRTRTTFRIKCSNCLKTEDEDTAEIPLNILPEDLYEKVKHVFNFEEQLIDEQEGLSARETDVLRLVAQGFSNKEIAEKLFISIHTVMSHRKNITEKLGIKSISGLTVYAIINNFIDTKSLDVKALI